MSDERSLDKAPPSRVEAELAVLSAVLLDNQALITVMEMLEPDDFYVGTHRVIFTAMREMSDKAMPVDILTLTDHLKATGRLETVGGFSAVTEISGRVSTAANVSYWARIVKDKALLRNFISETTALITEAYGEPEEVEEFLDRAEGKIMEISSNQTVTTYAPINQVVTDTFKIIEELDKRKGAVSGIGTGFADLDKMTSGFQRGDLIILAGRPSMGKTALALNFMRNAAVNDEAKVAFFSLEMAATQLVMRMICSEAMIPFDRLRLGSLPEKFWIKLTNAANTLSRAGVYIEDSANLSVLELKAKARRIKIEFGLDMVVVDYLQLVRGTGSKKSQGSREQEIAEISRSLKGMAKELEIPVLALSQLNRAPEQRESGEPKLSDLRESGSLEQDADLVMLIHRPGAYKKKKEEEEVEQEDNRTVLKIEKQRNGPTGPIDLVFLKKYTKFEPYEGRYDSAYMPEN